MLCTGTVSGGEAMYISSVTAMIERAMFAFIVASGIAAILAFLAGLAVGVAPEPFSYVLLTAISVMVAVGAFCVGYLVEQECVPAKMGWTSATCTALAFLLALMWIEASAWNFLPVLVAIVVGLGFVRLVPGIHYPSK